MSDDRHEPDWNLVARNVTGEASADERARLAEWTRIDSRREDLLHTLQRAFSETKTHDATADVDAVLARIKAAESPDVRVLRLSAAQPAGVGRWLHTSGNRAAAWRWLAAAVLVIGVGLAWRFARRPAAPAVIASPITMTEVSARRAERARVRLPDGTEIVLAPASRLRYASDYGVRDRAVELDGQALFRVQHDSVHPFTVRTRDATISDLGTTFVVEEFLGERPSVVVVEGSVAVLPAVDRSNRASTILSAGDKGRMSGDGVVHVVHGVPLDKYVAWTEGRLVFDDTPLSEVAARLSRWFDIDVRIPSETAASRHLTASYRDESVAEIIQLIAASLDLKAERRGRSVVFRDQQ